MNVVCKTSLAGMVLLLLSTQKGAAQYSPSKYEAGLNIGSLIYQGDLAASRIGYTRDLKPSIGIWVSRNLNAYFSLRGNLTIGSLRADESKQAEPAYRQYRNFAFRTPVTELSALLVWNVAGTNSVRRLNYYFMGGAGIALLNVKRDWSRMDRTYFTETDHTSSGLGLDTTHATPRLMPVLPLGAGLRYGLSPAWSLNAEFIYRFTPTDYLDGFSQTVNAKTKDRYYGLTLGISYRFGANSYRCPKVAQ